MTLDTVRPTSPALLGGWEQVRAELEALLEGVPVLLLGRQDVLTQPHLVPPSGIPTVHLLGTAALVLGGQGCPLCLSRRWQGAQSVPVREAVELSAQVSELGGPVFVPPAVAQALAPLLEVARKASSDRVFRLDLHSLVVTTADLEPDPACPACGIATGVPHHELGPSTKPDPGRSFRARRPADYDLPTRALVNPVCGLLGRGLVPELDLPTTSPIWGCFATRTTDDMYEIFWAGHAHDYDSSVRIGMLEGLERYSGMQPRSGDRAIVAALSELDGRPALDPRRCGLYSDDFYLDAPDVVSFSEDLKIPWVQGFTLPDREPVLVPEIVAYYHSSAPEKRFVQECSNGCASGATLTEAIYCGLLELVERDAFLLAWYGRAELPELDPASSTRPEVRMMAERMVLHGYRARLFDARISFGIPVVIGVAERIDGGAGALCFGAGAGLDVEEAVSAAMAEISTDSMNARRRTERLAPTLRPLAEDFTKVLRIHDHSLLYGLPEMREHARFLLDRPGATPRPISSVTGPEISTDLRDDLDWCVQHLGERGFEVIAVDQTAPEQERTGLRTAGVIVPGLLPLDFGWYRQRALRMPRMRTALREAGLARHDLEYADLHHVPHPFP